LILVFLFFFFHLVSSEIFPFQSYHQTFVRYYTVYSYKI
jgi:hypothetical protein